MTVKINPQRLLRTAEPALKRTVERLGTAIQAGFDDPSYAWPGVTKRRSGELAGTTRNVIDLGSLKGSQTAPVKVGRGHYRISWESDHAAAVFPRARCSRSGAAASQPATCPLNVLREFDFAKAFAQEWR